MLVRCPLKLPVTSGIAAVWAFETRHAGTVADSWTVADGLFISQIYNVNLRTQAEFFTVTDVTLSSPNCSNTHVGSSFLKWWSLYYMLNRQTIVRVAVF